MPATARAQRCDDDGRAWVERCSKSSGIAMELVACPSSVAIVSTRELRVEISTSKSAYLQVNGYGLSPIGDFADWKLEPSARRNALDAIARCVSADPPQRLLLPDSSSPTSSSEVPPPARIPWILLFGTLLSLIACVRRFRPTAFALALVLATFLLRRLLEPYAFLHQNGQGPLWIEFAYRGDAGEYGPGYPEIFGWVAQVRRPDRGIAVLQEAMAATVPLSTYAIARSVGADRKLAWLLGAAMVLDPVLTRIARSESYFSVIASLIFAAAAVVATTDRRHRAIGLVAASLLVAQAARVHPLAWVPCALVPLVLMCRPGRLIDRARRTAIAMVVVAFVCFPLLYGAMRAVLLGELGTGFMPGVWAVARSRLPLILLLLAAALALAIAPATRRIGSRVAVLAFVFGFAFLGDVLSIDAAVIHAAHLHLFLPAAIAAVSAIALRALLAIAAPRLRAAYLYLAFAAIAVFHWAREHRLSILSTDARELDWALQWREELPLGAEVTSLRRADDRLLMLPLIGQGLPRYRDLDEEGRIGPGARYYYRSSLCSTPAGAPLCARFESTHALRPLASRRFPSIASLPWQPLPPGEIEVALFVIE